MNLVCEWCGEQFETDTNRGPKPKYCRQSHRQRAYEVRKVTKALDDMSEGFIQLASTLERVCADVMLMDARLQMIETESKQE